MKPVRDRPSVGRRATILAAVVAAVVCVVPSAHGQASVGRIAGRVIDELGAPVPDATVRAESPTASPHTLTGTTDDKGQFAILGLRTGMWTITVTADGFEPTEIDLPVRSRTNIPSMRLTLRRARSRGTRPRLAGVDLEALQAALGEAEALAADGRVDAALAAYERLAADVPALTSIHREIGDLCLRKKDRVGALEAYQRLLDAEPKDDAARTRVAALALELGLEAEAAGDRDGAVRFLEQALAAAPDAPGAGDARAALSRIRKA